MPSKHPKKVTLPALVASRIASRLGNAGSASGSERVVVSTTWPPAGSPVCQAICPLGVSRGHIFFREDSGVAKHEVVSVCFS